MVIRVDDELKSGPETVNMKVSLGSSIMSSLMVTVMSLYMSVIVKVVDTGSKSTP